LSDLSSLTPFRSNGINAIVVKSQSHGRIYISDRIQGLSELLEILEPHLPENGRDPGDILQRLRSR
jgi:hypothetical protein